MVRPLGARNDDPGLVCPVCGIACHLDDVTRERIRQIEAKALRQLRAPERARRLRALMAAR
ncbi:MAG TPA: sigma factor-like helix-turn-helix DNA-binding protein [Bryobacteraceae bacterium]|jgi:hypothetical protein